LFTDFDQESNQNLINDFLCYAPLLTKFSFKFAHNFSCDLANRHVKLCLRRRMLSVRSTVLPLSGSPYCRRPGIRAVPNTSHAAGMPCALRHSHTWTPIAWRDRWKTQLIVSVIGMFLLAPAIQYTLSVSAHAPIYLLPLPIDPLFLVHTCPSVV